MHIKMHTHTHTKLIYAHVQKHTNTHTHMHALLCTNCQTHTCRPLYTNIHTLVEHKHSHTKAHALA